jgi:hypothetical protein
MGQAKSLTNGKKVIPLDLKADSVEKKLFYKWLVNRDINDINAYWAKLLFSGRAIPPYTVKSPQQVIEYVSKNPHAIGYIDEKDLTETVQAIHELK